MFLLLSHTCNCGVKDAIKPTQIITTATDEVDFNTDQTTTNLRCGQKKLMGIPPPMLVLIFNLQIALKLCLLLLIL